MNSDDEMPVWVLQAAQLPIAFAQVREDSLIDLQLLERISGNEISGMMIASGGCTAAALAATGRLAHLHLVDINPAQIALTRVKLHLLQTAMPFVRMRALGHADTGELPLAPIMQSLHLPPEVFGPPQVVAEAGLDYAGRYEMLFARLRIEMRGFEEQWTEVLNLTNTSARVARTMPDTPLGRAMDDAFDRVMALPNLVRLFGSQATQNSVVPFSRHFAARTRHAIATLPTADNPYLWQLLRGRFPKAVVYPWLSAAAPKRMPDVVTTVARFDSALAPVRSRFDFVHLSNILDWLTPDEAKRVLESTWNALRPGGYVWIRQLNSTLQLPELCTAFSWLDEEAAALHSRDRSFFYSRLYLGRKR